MFGIWFERPKYWNKVFRSHSLYIHKLVKGFQDVRICRLNFNNVRDSVRGIIHANNPNLFPLGPNFASVNDLLRTLLVEQIPAGWLMCPICHTRLAIDHGNSIHFDILPGTGRSTVEWVNSLFSIDNPPVCQECNVAFDEPIHLSKIPHIVTFDISSLSSRFIISTKIKLLKNTRNTILKIYFGNNHFVMRMFDCNGNVWFHDGQGNSGIIIKECYTIDNMNLNKCQGKLASILIYGH
ncbi:hypothetical protein JVT61DRAFT_1606 [Boletus reticuloceps]|uniref:Uncharacterized protein n=1 Tax=Boletus reticuloceps TaxID=495285 RepID=A0A8I3AAV1_9AGAM|nr:hypothetical protein JVT61DRAFT_1606 [Boletus reticuloceps]